MKISKEVGVHSIAYHSSGVEGMLELQDGIRTNNKQINYSHKPTQINQ